MFGSECRLLVEVAVTPAPREGLTGWRRPGCWVGKGALTWVVECWSPDSSLAAEEESPRGEWAGGGARGPSCGQVCALLLGGESRSLFDADLRSHLFTVSE